MWSYTAVTKSRGLGIFPGYYEREPWLLSKENRAKRTLKCTIPLLLIAYTWQLEIQATTLCLSR